MPYPDDTQDLESLADSVRASMLRLWRALRRWRFRRDPQ
jgi:hypothetical protein